ncbi:uncharacterized protein LOC120651396 [Panicum virgatum]|uniref:uncharacterized protein LOC120651396 n=1 Tax=Panicum virgatum TaxID=38727 RepID=UPI0019D4FF07|nr:uncharacterized protein LOC120651396 [Panicum virgatum]
MPGVKSRRNWTPRSWAGPFATDAVRVLSRYPDVEEDENPRLALAGILLMVCESAKLNTLHQYFLGRWDNGSSTGTPSILMNNGYTRSDDKWLINLQTGTASVLKSLSGPQDALDIVHLVFNYCPRQIDMEYTIKDNKEGFTTFIEELRRKLADHEHRENVWDGHHPVQAGVVLLNSSQRGAATAGRANVDYPSRPG